MEKKRLYILCPETFRKAFATEVADITKDPLTMELFYAIGIAVVPKDLSILIH
jgi:hypothetical protein